MRQIRLNPRKRPSFGFALVELMVSLVIGLFLLGGVGAVFLSTQQASLTKQRLDVAMEAFRYGAYTISRHIRQADAVNSIGTDGVNPFVRLDMGAGAHDCSGDALAANAIVELKLDKSTSELKCTTNPGTGTAAQTILQPISDISFACRTSSTSGQLVSVTDADCRTRATALLVTIGVRSDVAANETIQSFLVTPRN